MADINISIRKLINAINTKGYKLLYSKKQYIDRAGKFKNYYIISTANWNEERKRFDNVDIYGSSSTIRIVLYLRDMWFRINNWELPTDNEIWNKVRKEIEARDGKG